MTTNTILITGAAGFIGYHLCQNLLASGKTVIGIDNLNNYYDVGLKQTRLEQLTSQSNFWFFQLDIADRSKINELFTTYKPNVVVNLAATSSKILDFAVSIQRMQKLRLFSDS